MNTKRTALVLAHQDGKKNAGTRNSCTLIVHEIPHFVQRLLIGAGAGGLGLAVGSALPPLLGLTAWRWDLTLAGLALLAVGCIVEMMAE